MKLTANQKIDPQPMVQWFNPILLAKLGWQVIVSALFGTYADHRVIRSALDDVSKETQAERADLIEQGVINPDKDGAVWIDYVSDLGEGFSSTYAMASLLAEPQLTIEGSVLPQGDVLIMGGDEVYPTASREQYKIRMREPYELAFPDSRKNGARHPRLYAIPGNHDWYDGLDAFSGTFCRYRDQEPQHGGLRIGSWRCKQSRSYFALKLTEDCWLWGLDIQLKGYVDQPQIEYFQLIVAQLPENARIILCTAQPSWLKAEKPGDQEYKSLNYVAQIIERAGKNRKVYLMIAGDIHHYSRYSENNSGMEFITAGGGGAFLHPTHQLPQNLVGEWLKKPINLRLAHDKSNPQKNSCYPDMKTSKSLLWGNWKFIFQNWDFCAALGIIFGILANLLELPDANTVLGILNNGNSSAFTKFSSLFFQTFHSTWSVAVATIVIAIMIIYADVRMSVKKILIGTTHAIIHLFILIGFTLLFQNINASFFKEISDGFPYRLLLFAEMAVACFLFAGIIWGVYLSTTCWLFGIHTNDGFSAMQIANYKNFMRIRIGKDDITVFPIGLKSVPELEDWEVNPSPSEEASPQSYLPTSGLKPHFIETPVVIETSIAPST